MTLPNIELIKLPVLLDSSVSTDVLAAAAKLEQRGAPRQVLNGRFDAAEAASLLQVGGRPLVRFGRALSSDVCLAIPSCEVVSVGPDGVVRFVNSSLERFIETAMAVTARFPFYGEDDSEETVEQAASDVATAIRAVEERALERDGFWATLVDDINMGDFVTEWVVSGR